MSAPLFNIFAEVLADAITDITSSSFYTGMLPARLKISKILPAFRKGVRLLPSNYRLVAFVPTISKTFEKIIFSHLQPSFWKHNFSKHERLYLVNHSLLLGTHYSYDAYEEFHLIGYTLLLAENSRLNLMDARSSKNIVSVNVPHRSVLEPILFVMFINDLSSCLGNGTVCWCW